MGSSSLSIWISSLFFQIILLLPVSYSLSWEANLHEFYQWSACALASSCNHPIGISGRRLGGPEKSEISVLISKFLLLGSLGLAVSFG